ncbi:hypothetical protein [Flavobacterium sp.]|uniref:hypothetical protein n=1 Tax=Flavobacterium sp. TaxID=239 RepID=UPI002612CB26|nr:hypothetical protein [Flavobacterium sp.]
MAIAFALIIFIANMVFVFVFRKLKISIKKINFMYNPFISLIKFRRNNVEYSLGWLPIGGYVGPQEEIFEFENEATTVTKSRITLHLYNLSILLVLFFVIVFGRYNSFKGFENLYHFFNLSYQMVKGDITAPMLINTLQQKGIWNDFVFIFSLFFSYTFLGYLLQLAEEIKKIGWLLKLSILACSLFFGYVHLKIFLVCVTLMDLMYFYDTMIVVSALLLGITFLILKNFHLQEQNDEVN